MHFFTLSLKPVGLENLSPDRIVYMQKKRRMLSYKGLKKRVLHVVNAVQEAVIVPLCDKLTNSAVKAPRLTNSAYKAPRSSVGSTPSKPMKPVRKEEAFPKFKV